MQETAHGGFLVAAIVLCSLTRYISASDCYPDYCLRRNLSDLVPAPGFQCVLTAVEKGNDCATLSFANDEKPSRRNNAAIFTLRAYVTDLNHGRVTAFNLSVSDINFDRLVTRYQNLVDFGNSYCRHIELYANASRPRPKDFYVSCPFSGSSYEESSYSLEYLVKEKNFAYSRKYIFRVPHYESIEDGVHVKMFTPFVYIDVTDPSNPSLHIQPLPARYNVTEYKAWLINNETDSPIAIAIIPAASREDRRHVRFNFSAPDGIYYIKVAVLDPECGKHGCANSTTPYIYMKHASDRLLIMIISLIWIPPVILYAVYHAFKLYRKNVLKRMAIRPNCLLVYSPTHPSHVNVMAELTKYLRYCNINAMIDLFDIAETSSKDPGLWCNTAFQTADVVLVVTSPPMSVKSDATIVYRNVDNHLLRLLKENYPRRNKRYFAVHLPYCKSNHIPDEARLFKRFCIPEDLTRLVKTIHGIVCLRFFASSDHELLESIKFATAKISEDEAANTTRNTDGEETDDLLSPIVVKETANCNADRPIDICRPDTSDKDSIPQSFMTRIENLDLLQDGTREEIDEKRPFVENSNKQNTASKLKTVLKNNCEHPIGELNL